VKILIGYDGSRHADAALADLRAAGLPAKAEAKVVTVTTPWKGRPPQGLGGSRLEREAEAIAVEARRQGEALAEKAAERLRQAFPDWRVTSEALLDHPAEGLVRRAESWKADLVVMGCRGRTALGRLLLGSVTTQVLNHAPCDVRVSRPRRRPGSAPKVLVAVDGSVGSDQAVAAAAARHWPRGTRIRVIAALEGIGLTDTLRGMRESLLGGSKHGPRAWVDRKCASAARRLATPGVAVGTAVRIGDPRLVILREARDWDADCLFVGSRGLAGIERFLLGSVSGAVSAHAPCTVEVIRKRIARRKAGAR
jgi:nucleotide-binding universal stress UspA family protein